MTSIGTGYDLSNSVLSPDGRNFQVEYASKAVEADGTALGIRCADGVVLAVEKIVSSKLLVPGANKKIQTIDKHVGVAYSGLGPDGRQLVEQGRSEAYSWRGSYRAPISVSSLTDRLAGYVQAYTLYNSVRPFGVSAIIGGVDETGAHLYTVEPSGAYWGYLGAATGKGRQAAKSELEKLNLPNISARDAVKAAARIIYAAHDDYKDKDFELEISWASISETSGRHEFIPKDLLEEAERLAKQDDDEDEDEDEDMEED
ncbi:nucleophile aminohydrolase [Limtongia smithiae]|uniref:nucleophile aminohydrolase n=1 Tax=Limtongia smithiae TaxID=1125753 RepID=UPI0034CE72EE